MSEKRNKPQRGIAFIPILLCIVLGFTSVGWLVFRPHTTITIESESFNTDTTVGISWITSAEYYAKTIIGAEPTFSEGDSLEKALVSGSNKVSFSVPTTLIRKMKAEIQQEQVADDNKAEVCTRSVIWGKRCSQITLDSPATECAGEHCTRFTSFTVPSYNQTDISLAVLILTLSTAGAIILMSANTKTISHLSKKIHGSKLYAQLDLIGTELSEDHLLRLDGKAVLLVIMCAIFFVISVLFQVHTSSVYMWNNYHGQEHQQEGLLAGRPEAIRSDEWLVKTPSIFSQSYHEYQDENENIGDEKSPLAMSLPVKSLTTVFRPQMWGYFIFGAERGFVFEWNFMAVSLFIGTFLCLMLFTKNQFALSLIGSIWLYFASYTQWWFSSVSGILMSFMFMIVGGIYLLCSKKKASILAGGIIFLFSTINFFLFLYPPYLIPLLYIAAGIALATAFKERDSILNKHVLPIRLAGILCVIAIGSLIGYIFLREIGDTITAVGNTVYPGNRTSEGGTMDILWVLSGYFTFLIRDSSFPAVLGNTSEASNFILLSPLIVPLAVYGVQIKKIQLGPLHIALGIIILVLGAWMIIPFPEILRNILFLDRVFERRALLGLGIADLFFSMSLISLVQREKILTKKILAIWWTICTLFMMFWGITLFHESDFLNIPTIILVSAAISSFLCLLTAKKFLTAILSGMFILFPTMIINPISTGVNVFEDEELSQMISDHPAATWAVYGNSNYANLLKAYGADVFNGVKYLPEDTLLRTLDPEGTYTFIYNRYAHISLQIPDPASELFVLTNPDSYTIYIDPCNPVLKEIGITHVLFTSPLDTEPPCGIRIFSRHDGDVTLNAYKLQHSKDMIESVRK